MVRERLCQRRGLIAFVPLAGIDRREENRDGIGLQWKDTRVQQTVRTIYIYLETLCETSFANWDHVGVA